MIDANDIEKMAKERPDECFLKGSGVLKLTGAIRQLEKQNAELLAALAAAKPSTNQIFDKWVRRVEPWRDYPIGTKARESWSGGYWIKTDYGWKWPTGSTFPTPGTADEVMLPSTNQEVSK